MREYPNMAHRYSGDIADGSGSRHLMKHAIHAHVFKPFGSHSADYGRQ